MQGEDVRINSTAYQKAKAGIMLLPVLINVLLLLATALIEVQNGATIFLCCGIGSACGLMIFYQLATGRWGIRLTWMLAGSLLIGYCGGCFNSMLTMQMSGRNAIQVLGISPSWVAHAQMLVILAASVLLVVGTAGTPFSPR